MSEGTQRRAGAPWGPCSSGRRPGRSLTPPGPTSSGTGRAGSALFFEYLLECLEGREVGLVLRPSARLLHADEVGESDDRDHQAPAEVPRRGAFVQVNEPSGTGGR